MGCAPIFTACKRSSGQGNMFTGVCLSTGGGAWSGGGGCLLPGGSGPGDVPAPGGAWSGDACSGGSGQRGCLLPGGSAPGGGGVPGRDPQRLLLRTVRILLECILDGYCDCNSYSSHSKQSQSQSQSNSQPQSRNKWQM